MKKLLVCALLMFAVASAPRAGAALVLDEAEQHPTPALETVSDEDQSASADLDTLQIDTVDISTSAAANRSALIFSVKEAEMLFNKADKSFTKGNSDKAQELYDQSLTTLAQAGLDAAVLNELRDEFKTIFAKLNTTLHASAAKHAPGASYKIPMDENNELVQKYLKLYTENASAKRLIMDALKRSGRYRPMILQTLKEYDLPEELVYLPVVESLYRVGDRSHAGALGLWQIMPHRARALDLKLNYWVDERKDPVKSTRAAAQYLRELYLMLDDWHLVLAGYNRGEFGLVRDLKFSNATTICEMADRRAVPKETRLYVPQFIAVCLIAAHPKKYGYDFEYDPPLAYDTIKVSSVIDLKIVAQCAGSTVQAIRELNPSLLAWCTPHNAADFELHIPSGTAALFTENIAKVKDLNPDPGYIKYTVQKNDWLEKIAKKFSTTVTAIKEDNARIRSQKYLRIGQVLIIRPGRKYRG